MAQAPKIPKVSATPKMAVARVPKAPAIAIGVSAPKMAPKTPRAPKLGGMKP